MWKKTARQIKSNIEKANKSAIEKMGTSRPFLVDIKPAMEVFKNMKKNSISHAGPANKMGENVWTAERSNSCHDDL